MRPEWHAFVGRQALADALAGRVAAALERMLALAGAASLAVSGGSTPALFFARLSDADIGWEKVWVTLVDERWVDEGSERSNARLVRERLLAGRAAAARFVGYHSPDLDADEGAMVAAKRIAAMERPFGAVVLGMGDDGHTASWFAGGSRLCEAIKMSCAHDVVAMRAQAAGEVRVTMTLPAVTDTAFLALHIEGERKREVMERAFGEGPDGEMPVRAVLRQTRAPAEVFWCP